MHRILLKTTIPFREDDWHTGRFSLLQEHLRSLTGAHGSPLYDVEARDRIEDAAGGDRNLQAVTGTRRAGAPSFVSEPWGDGMQRSPEAQADVRRYAENIAAWLAGSRR
jgi:hypothetical protein